jgi:hypothetical protein
VEYIGLVCFVLAGISEGVMDTIQFHYTTSIFFNFKKQLFWDPEISWKNKYKNGDPKQGAKFPLSVTLLVGLTDAWHFFKLLRNLFIFIGVLFLALPTNNFWICVLWVALARIAFGLSFTISYRKMGV